MKIAIAVGIILNAGVLSVIAYQQNQQTAEQGSQVVGLLKQLEKPEPVQEPEENPLAGKIDKLVALAERAEQREVEPADLLGQRKVEWEYKVIKLKSGAGHLFTAQKMKRPTIDVDLQFWKSFGGDGWELATSYVEHETAFPNFGNDEYHTGVKPNIRPSVVVFVFKRRGRP